MSPGDHRRHQSTTAPYGGLPAGKVASMLGHAVKTTYLATLLTATAGLVVGLGVAPAAAAVTGQALVGAWSGPATIGNTGDCGAGSGIYSFSPNGTYRYSAVFEGCDSVMIDGQYELQADGSVLQLSLDQCGDSGCAWPTFTTSINVIDADNFVLDGRYPYKREHA
jgi:hypothetical protein